MMTKSLHPKSVIILVASCCLVASQTQGQGGGGGGDSPSSSASTGSSCSAPPEGCTNGMFKQSTCTCQCIPPFCPVDGNCLTVETSCEDPWKDCKMGVDCPWWVNYLTTEECTTGPVVPDGLWQVYPSEEECCSTNFPDSTTCYIPMEAVPTKHPTIALENTDGEETVPIQFVVMGVPDDVSLNAVKAEMLSALKRVLLRLKKDNPDLEVINVEEKLMRRKQTKKRIRHLLKKESTLLMPLLLPPQEERIAHSPLNHHHHYRSLEQNVEVVFDVTVVAHDSIQFGPYIIEAIRNSYDEVISEIQSFSDVTYIGGLDMNFCTMESGGYNNCAVEKPEVAPSSSPYGGGGGSSTSISSTADSEDQGLAGWAIALIVMFVLSIVFCGGYAVAVMFFGVTNCFKIRDNDPKETFQNNIYLDGDGNSRYSNRERDARSIAGHSQQLVLVGPQSEVPDDDVFTINTYATSSRRKVSRDPTMYIPGQEGRPDPNPDMLRITYGDASISSHRYSSDGHSLKPQREPTMYVDGVPFAEKLKRDPTMYVEGQSHHHAIYEEGDEEDDDEQYQTHDGNGREDYNRSEQSITRKHSVFMEEVSLQTGNQSLASKSARSKKSRSSDKKPPNNKEKPARRINSEDSREFYPSYPDLNYHGQNDNGIARPSAQNSVAASLFDLNASTPNLYEDGLVGKDGHKRQTKSFYR